MCHPTTFPFCEEEFYLLALHLLNAELLKELLLHTSPSLNQRTGHTCSTTIPSLRWDWCNEIICLEAPCSLLPSDNLDHCKRQTNLCPNEMGAEATKDSSVCLVQKEKMQILQKEGELKITLMDAKRSEAETACNIKRKKLL